MSAISFVTLGPAGTNHHLVASKYLAFHDIAAERLRLVGSIGGGLAEVRAGTADYLIVCAVHPEAPRAVGRYFREVFVVDTFISPSRPLAVLARREVAAPRSIGVLHPSTSDYVDLARWEHVERITDGSLHNVAHGLLEGRYDAGLVYLDYAATHPKQLRVVEELGSPDDAWLVLGRQRTFREPVLAWKHTPVAALFHQHG
jgi:hypothetical protein